QQDAFWGQSSFWQIGYDQKTLSTSQFQLFLQAGL
ncbi:hypothetical protein ECDEC7B_5251, partial [Escherichia coli DEC7B]